MPNPLASCGGSMAEQLRRWTRNPEALSSSPALTASWITSWSSQVKILVYACK